MLIVYGMFVVVGATVPLYTLVCVGLNYQEPGDGWENFLKSSGITQDKIGATFIYQYDACGMQRQMQRMTRSRFRVLGFLLGD